MRPLIQEIPTAQTPESLVEQLGGEPGRVLLRTLQFDSSGARYSFVTARPFLTFVSHGSRCEIASAGGGERQFGNPWRVLEALMSRLELLEEIDWPFPLGGAFGFWGYELKNFTEPRLPRRAVNDLELPDCHVGFYDSLVAFDHRSGKVLVISTGLEPDGSRSEAKAGERLEFWRERLTSAISAVDSRPQPPGRLEFWRERLTAEGGGSGGPTTEPESNISRGEFITAVERAQRYIRAGDIYQVNLSHRLTVGWNGGGWELFQRLAAVSPAPFAAFLECEGGGTGRFEVASSSPEQFLRMSGRQMVTRPIKGTRPRGGTATEDAQLAYELQTSAKELAELVMITDLLRNDLGRICEYGSIQAPELARLERFSQVQHLVSTVEGRLSEEITHAFAFASCFPGGSITGAPKIRAMEIIDELEPVARGPYTGALGYLGFNRESQLAIAIRTAIIRDATAWFHAGAGIVADSIAEAEYEETLAKAGGFIAALETGLPAPPCPATRPNPHSKAGSLEF